MKLSIKTELCALASFSIVGLYALVATPALASVSQQPLLQCSDQQNNKLSMATNGGGAVLVNLSIAGERVLTQNRINRNFPLVLSSGNKVHTLKIFENKDAFVAGGGDSFPLIEISYIPSPFSGDQAHLHLSRKTSPNNVKTELDFAGCISTMSSEQFRHLPADLSWVQTSPDVQNALDNELYNRLASSGYISLSQGDTRINDEFFTRTVGDTNGFGASRTQLFYVDQLGREVPVIQIQDPNFNGVGATLTRYFIGTPRGPEVVFQNECTNGSGCVTMPHVVRF